VPPDLDHTAGQEIVLGAEGAADAVLYRARVSARGRGTCAPSLAVPHERSGGSVAFTAAACISMCKPSAWERFSGEE
jgi:hypothetical protein